MKNIKKKITIVALALISSTPTFAELISYSAYTLNTETNIVSGYGLEWLQWDVTAGMSINEAINNLEDGSIDGVDYGRGWEVASNIHMAALFNSFLFGGVYYWAPGAEPSITTWDTDEDSSQQAFSILSPDDISVDPEIQFVNLFGQIGLEIFTGVLFGQDIDQDSFFNMALVYDDYTYVDSIGFSSITIEADTYSQFFSDENLGVAFVREFSSANIPVLPEPNTLALFTIGLLSLRFFRK